MICANFGIFIADSIAALLVAIIVLFVSYRLGKKAIDVLLDKAPQDTIVKVQQVLEKYDEVKHFHSLKVRTAGADTFIKFNIHVNPDSSVRNTHELCDKIEKELNKIIPRSEVYIHVEPQEIKHIKEEENKD